MTSTTPFEPALVRIEPACRYLDVGRSKLYELIREGKLEAVKIGKSAHRAAGVVVPDIITNARAAIFRAMAGGSYASAFG